MTQKFCDLCGKIAIQKDINSKFMAFENYGDKYTSYRNVSASQEQCVIRAHVMFNFHNHESGFGGPPDLCESCAKKLVAKTIQEAHD